MKKSQLFLFPLLLVFLICSFCEAASADEGASTGETPVEIKSRSGHSVHGNYQNNTNTCANCHSTHQGENEKLLFQKTTYDTCVYCHDGSMGFYNVFEKDVARDNGAGTFGGTEAGNMSVHMSTGQVNIGSAPGSGATQDSSNEKWNAELTCTSCHAPHGSDISRLLKADINDYANTIRVIQPNGSYSGGKIPSVLIDALSGSGGLESRQSIWSGGATTTSQGDDIRAAKFQLSAADVNSGNYRDMDLQAGDWIIQVFKYDEYSLNKTWRPVAFSARTAESVVEIVGTDGAVIDWEEVGTSEVVILAKEGIIKIPADLQASIASLKNLSTIFSFTLPLVETEVASTGQQLYRVEHDSANNPSYRFAMGQMNEWCSSCHQEFFGMKKNETADNFEHHAITATNGCLHCHYAHGTDVTWMKDAEDKTLLNHSEDKLIELLMDNPSASEEELKADSRYISFMDDKRQEMLDQNGTSALKRYTNMTGCFGCHLSPYSE